MRKYDSYALYLKVKRLRQSNVELAQACLTAREWIEDKREPAELVPAILDIDCALWKNSEEK